MFGLFLCAIFVVSGPAFCDDAVKITVIHTTDIHGWINGHPHEVSYDTTLGDLYNFAYHLNESTKNSEKDELLLLFDTGDLTQGTGLSDATEVPGEYIFEQVQKIPYDGLCIGNHELGTESVPVYIAKNVYPFWNGKYLAANVELKDKSDPDHTIGDAYTFHDLPNGQGKILIVGFLYTMLNAVDNVIVTGVEETLHSDVFTNLDYSDDIKLVVALLHISTMSDEVDVVYNYFHEKLPLVPILLLTGHSHQINHRFFNDSQVPRANGPIDLADNAKAHIYTTQGLAVEDGCYMRNIGVISFNLSMEPTGEPINYNVTYLTATRSDLIDFVGLTEDTWETNVSKEIAADNAKKSDELSLSRILGYSPAEYKKSSDNNKYNETVFSLIANEFLPTYRKHYRDVDPGKPVNTLHIVSYSSVRTAIYPGPFYEDDLYSIDPFNNNLNTIIDVKGSDVVTLQHTDIVSDATSRLNYYDDNSDAVFTSKYYLTSTNPIDNNTLYDLVTTSYDVGRILNALASFSSTEYTSVDSGAYFRVMLNTSIQSRWNPQNENNSNSGITSTEIIISISVAAVVLLIIVVAILVYCCCRKKHPAYTSDESTPLTDL